MKRTFEKKNLVFRNATDTLELPTISNQIRKGVSISSLQIRNIWYFDRNSSFCFEILGFKLLGFSFEITRLFCQNAKIERMQVYTYICHVTLYSLVRSCIHFGWLHAPYLRAYHLDVLLVMKNNEKNKREICILSRQTKKLQREKLLTNFLHGTIFIHVKRAHRRMKNLFFRRSF